MAVWCAAFLILGARLSVDEIPRILKSEAPAPDTRPPVISAPTLKVDFSRTVNEALMVIGHGLGIDRVEVARIDLALAGYGWEENTIYINGDLEHNEEDLLEYAAHECVHAIFTHARLKQYAHLDLDHAHRIEETTAYVLGAYVAGEMMSRRGGDGAAFTSQLVAEYRADCDPKNPRSRHRKWRRMRDTMHIDNHQPWVVRHFEVHYWSPRLVDEIDQICQSHPDPWEAARAIAKKYRLID